MALRHGNYVYGPLFHHWKNNSLLKGMLQSSALCLSLSLSSDQSFAKGISDLLHQCRAPTNDRRGTESCCIPSSSYSIMSSIAVNLHSNCNLHKWKSLLKIKAIFTAPLTAMQTKQMANKPKAITENHAIHKWQSTEIFWNFPFRNGVVVAKINWLFQLVRTSPSCSFWYEHWL